MCHRSHLAAIFAAHFWRGARVVDRVCLENRCARKGTGGSNPSLSAKAGRADPVAAPFFFPAVRIAQATVDLFRATMVTLRA